MNNLLVQEGGMIELESVSLQTATYVKLQPQSEEFLDISNPKAVLERALRSFACLSVGDMIVINYNNKQYEMSVLELKPANAVSIIECDMNVSLHSCNLVGGISKKFCHTGRITVVEKSSRCIKSVILFKHHHFLSFIHYLFIHLCSSWYT
mgnify:CR=1 FL=1